MAHKLALIALTGITVSAVCLGAAASLGAKNMDGLDLSFLGDRPRCETVAGATATSRDLEWDGSDHLGLSVSGHAQYTPGSGTKVHVSGDPQTLAHLRVRDGNIEMDCSRGWHSDSAALEITLPGRQFRRFSIAGSSDLQLNKLDQERLRVSIAGSGDVKADGRVDEVDIHIAGSGDADFGRVTGKVARVHIAGSGDTDIAPRDEADIHIAGSGDVNLHTNPARIEKHIAGSGDVHTVGGGT